MLGRNRGSAGSSRNVGVKLFSQTDLRFVLTSIELRPMNNSPVITRFAPSPTGFLHIGGARTALFNWLFAKANQGKFLLRIEDTDRERSTEEAEAAIIEGLQWLGLDWDGDAMSQHSRQRRHIEAARELLKLGAAYKCYSTPAEIENAKKEAKEAGCPTLFQSPWRNAGTAAAPDAPFTIRLKTPVEGQTEIRDSVYGKLSWKNETIEDLVILRSDGSPTYNLAVVVDDHDMGITHVIRGDDHLANSPKQHLIYKSFGWKTPEFAHVPLIYGEDGKKLSKRGGAVGVEYYRAAGIIPEATRNYLCRLGWSHGDNEFFTTEQAIDWFSLEGFRKSPARLDSKKMMNVCGKHIAVADDSTLLTQLNVYLRPTIDNSFRSRWNRTSWRQCRSSSSEQNHWLKLPTTVIFCWARHRSSLPMRSQNCSTKIQSASCASSKAERQALNGAEAACNILQANSRLKRA